MNETSSKVSEKIVVRKLLAPKTEGKRREVLMIKMRLKHQDHPFQQTEPAEYSKCRQNWRYTLWKARRVRFVILFQESWIIKICTGSQRGQQEVIFQHIKRACASSFSKIPLGFPISLAKSLSAISGRAVNQE